MADHPTGNSEKKHLFDNPKNVSRAIYLLVAISVITAGFDLVFARHVEHPIENIFGFYPLFGFFSCAIVILGAKEMRKIVMRKEDYYDDK